MSILKLKKWISSGMFSRNDQKLETRKFDVRGKSVVSESRDIAWIWLAPSSLRYFFRLLFVERTRKLFENYWGQIASFSPSLARTRNPFRILGHVMIFLFLWTTRAECLPNESPSWFLISYLSRHACIALSGNEVIFARSVLLLKTQADENAKEKRTMGAFFSLSFALSLLPFSWSNDESVCLQKAPHWAKHLLGP